MGTTSPVRRSGDHRGVHTGDRHAVASHFFIGLKGPPRPFEKKLPEGSAASPDFSGWNCTPKKTLSRSTPQYGLGVAPSNGVVTGAAMGV